MSITLHWWMIPAALALFGVYLWIRTYFVDSWDSLGYGVTAIGLWTLAAMFCAGHWL